MKGSVFLVDSPASVDQLPFVVSSLTTLERTSYRKPFSKRKLIL